MYSVELKIKRKNLADEARDIRKEERRAKASYGGNSPEFKSLHYHRKGTVRSAARVAHLAHAFLTGRPYLSVERTCGRQGRPQIDSVAKCVARFGNETYRRCCVHSADGNESVHHRQDAEIHQLFAGLDKDHVKALSQLYRAIERWIEGSPIVELAVRADSDEARQAVA